MESQINSKIIFLHIPKTGGMSLRGLVVKNYRQEGHFNTELLSTQPGEWKQCLARIQNMPEEKLKRYRIFKGHMPFGLHEYLPPPVEYITFLRDPVQRAISFYRMGCRHRFICPRQVIDPSRADWNLGSNPGLGLFWDNSQTRILAGADSDLEFGACSHEHLRTAKANLDRHFSFVGLTEKFDLSLMLLRRLCGWGWHFYVPDNVASNPSVQLSPDVVKALRDLNRYDYELYAYAEERLQRLVDRHGWRLKAEHGIFRLGNRVHGQLHVWRHRLKKRFGVERRPAMIALPKTVSN